MFGMSIEALTSIADRQSRAQGASAYQTRCKQWVTGPRPTNGAAQTSASSAGCSLIELIAARGKTT